MQHNAPLIVDDFLSPSELEVERALALGSVFEDWEGPDGQVYKRICRIARGCIQAKVEGIMGQVDMLGMAYRLNFGGELPNAAIHSDLGWGTHALVLYLSDGETGTAFWRHRATGAAMIHAGDETLLEAVAPDWDNAEAWEQTALVRAKAGRAVIYDSATFHSRWPFEAAGEGPEDGRLILVAFFTPHHLRRATVRAAQIEDMPQIIRMGSNFYKTTNYANSIPVCVETCERLVAQLTADHILCVAEYRGELVGMIGCYVTPFLFNSDVTTAHEVFWWVDKSWRGSSVGADLLRAAEDAAIAMGARSIQMIALSTSPPAAAAIYNRAGFKHSETCFTKVIGRTDAAGQG